MIATDKISVVIPCFNAARYVVAAVSSVLAQVWPELEIIVVDDGSSDASAEAVRSAFPSAAFPSVTVLQQPNQGVAAARNFGIRHATGEWVAFLDADDIWLPGKLQAQIDLLQGHPSARMAYSAWQVWQSEEPAPQRPDEWLALPADEARWAGPSGWIYPQLLLDCEVWTSTVIARRSLFDEIGVFDTTLRVGEDYDLWLRASRVTPILRVPRPLALYRQHATSITRGAPPDNYRGIVVSRALAKWGYAQEQVHADRSQVDRALAKSWSDYAAANLEAGHLARARHGVMSSLRADPTHAGAWKALVRMALRSVSPRRAGTMP
ncbi:hypothetical protein BH11PSE9_BH11PSE9_01580 [soil metagenome]